MSSKSPITYQVSDNVARLTLNNKPVNALSKAVRTGILQALEEANADTNVAVIILDTALSLFSSGADITEFDAQDMEPFLPVVLDAIESSTKPVIAVLTGSAFGGGLELAMACHCRIALSTIKVGLPEVKLGLLPGAGGTQRLPRLTDLGSALQLITQGNPMSPKKLPGLFDLLVQDKDALPKAVEDFVKELEKQEWPNRQTRALNVQQNGSTDSIFEAAKTQLEKTAAGYVAPFKCLEAVQNSVTMDFDEGIKAEQALFMHCLNTPQSEALRHLFFAERQAAKLPKDVNKTDLREIKSVAVIGAGTMGGGIAMNFINVGIPVKLVDRDQDFIEKGIKIIAKNYEGAIRKGKITEEKRDALLSLITPTTHYEELADCDLVIEAVFEDLTVKQQVFRQLDQHCKPGAILATNTSTLDIDAIANVTERPEDVIGLHFFSPANVMPLLEVVRAAQSSSTVIATVMKLAKVIRKTPVLVKVCFGFVGNRMIEVYARESNRLLLEGATPQQVDKVIKDYGLAMGPFVMGDMAGLDIGYFIRGSRREFIAHDPSYCVIADRLVEAGRKGLKVGQGVYRYEPGSRTPIPDDEVLTIAKAEASKLGVEQRNIDDQEILERCIYPLINEGLEILEEGIAQRASDIDVIYAFGYGFPAWRGGPMHYAEKIGFQHILDRINHYRTQLGEYGEAWFKPSSLLEKLVGDSLTLNDIQKS